MMFGAYSMIERHELHLTNHCPEALSSHRDRLVITNDKNEPTRVIYGLFSRQAW